MNKINEATVKEIKQELEENNINIVYLHFPDLEGNIRTKGVLATEIIRTVHISMIDGISIDGSIIDGFESEGPFLIIPILETFTIINWEKNNPYKAAFMMCYIKNHNMDSRACVERLMSIANKEGLYPMCGMGLIYQIGEESETVGNDFYKLLPGSGINKFNVHLVNVLIDAGIDVECFMPCGRLHNSLAYVPQPILKGIDQILLSRWIAASLALEQSLSFNLLYPNENTNPIHISIWNQEHNKNLFYNPDDEYELSNYGYSFIAGILANFDEIFAVIFGSAKELCEVSYKKSFSVQNDECVISAPLYFVEKQKRDRVGWSKRCVLRGILPKANLYLVLSCVYMAGIDGIRNNLDVKDFIDDNYNVLSSTISEKIDKLEKNILFKNILGENIASYLIDNLKELEEK